MCIKGWGYALLILSHFLKYPMKIKKIGLIETKLFHFHRIFKNEGQVGGSSEARVLCKQQSQVHLSIRCSQMR